MDYLCYNLATLQANPADEALLDEGERVAYAKRGDIFLLERALLKRELERRTRKPACQIRFAATPHGKPYLPGGPHFNISHSGSWLCLAFHNAPVGVDIQQERSRLRLGQMACRIMCPAQYEAFCQRGVPEDEFYACWCAAEALVKQAAATLWQAARKFPFLYVAGRILPQYPDAPQVQLFRPAKGYYGAVAYGVQACQQIE